MSYVDGFLVPVPAGNKEAYRAMAAKAAALFIEHGATRVVEAWGDDIKPGKTNDFYTAIIREEGEEAVFSWIEWPDREARNAAWEKIMADERMKPEGEMPFAGARMIYGGFDSIVDLSAEK
ncbi:hypothetical protein GCM10007897_12580 [Sphingobium jiangsuense]|uniref:Uncharacterized protein YbaA (DUF1428 family) n=1 Tax=Sphingobium jiangsuense TaxID=870476 RepID=A0A7W6BIG0_9SPHN|nr:DUF1428 domain-containing protein [Sphingobium jiangsuense]MBB3925532.1 uncharacterized protein YbaA (DUF1428 family) [Sphingobium jiangsuense]GLS99875.1 hypothetical protein GCM10007897_12580 [Sphingobium jiangsuense]